MASLIRTIRRAMERAGSFDEAVANAPRLGRSQDLTRKRTKGGRKAETYRAARRAEVVKDFRADRRQAKAEAVAIRRAPQKPKPWARVTTRKVLPMVSASARRGLAEAV